MMCVLESSWNVIAHGDLREGKWKGNWRMESAASTLHTTLEHGVSSITTTDAHTSAASSRLNWRPRQFKWTCPFCWKMKSGFCVCAITFQMHSTTILFLPANKICGSYIHNRGLSPVVIYVALRRFNLLLNLELFNSRLEDYTLSTVQCMASAVSPFFF
jgi:hypothetical protein